MFIIVPPRSARPVYFYHDKAGRLPTRAITAAFIFGQVHIRHSYRFITALLFLFAKFVHRVRSTLDIRRRFYDVCRAVEIVQNPPGIVAQRLRSEGTFRTLSTKMCVTRLDIRD